MTVEQLLNRPCTIVKRSQTETEDDGYGNERPAETLIQTVCELQQLQRSEHDDAVSDTLWLIVFPAGTDIDAIDAADIEGERYQLIGDPWDARDPLTQAVSHVEATARRTGEAESS